MTSLLFLWLTRSKSGLGREGHPRPLLNFRAKSADFEAAISAPAESTQGSGIDSLRAGGSGVTDRMPQGGRFGNPGFPGSG